MLGRGTIYDMLFWVLILLVLYVFVFAKNRLSVASNEEKETMMDKNLYIYVLSFFELVANGITGLVVNSACGSTPLT